MDELMNDLNRRRFLKAMAAASAAIAMPLGPRDALAQAGNITVTSYGGIWETAIKNCFVADFEKKTGGKAAVVLGGPAQWMAQIEANKANPPIHTIMNTVGLAQIAGAKGLVEKITVEKCPNLKDIPQRFTDVAGGWGTCFDYGSFGIAYHKGRVKNPPKSFVEFIDRTAKGEWQAGLPTISYPSTEQILIWSFADILGGSADNIDPFFAAVKRMGKNIVWWASVTDFLNQLDSGEIDIGMYWDGRTWAHYDTGATHIGYVNPKEGGAMNPVVVQKAVNAPELAWKYIDSVLAPEPQAAFAKLLNYGVTNSKVVYPPGVKERVTPWEETRWPPFEKIAANLQAWTERWNKEIGKS